MSEKARRILLLGNSGKMGQALAAAFPGQDQVVCANSTGLDANDFSQVGKLIDQCRPDLLFNTVAFQGIDQCEREPEKALRLNTMLPKFLAECAEDRGFDLVHFSSDSVFNNAVGRPFSESDTPCPLNMYGVTKYGGDCFVQNTTRRHYLIRVSLLFGPTGRANQFVERMLSRIRNGEKSLRISSDVIASPTFSLDVASAVMGLISRKAPYGLYHIANAGQASLHDLMSRIVDRLSLDADIESCSHAEFPALGRKNTYTPIRSEKVAQLRPWSEAVDDYCRYISAEWRHNV
ncbi:spore coat polysaccharide biosynthesis protein SpsK [Geobacter sp. OR-1]|uniref:SDR family oxidoreductase n=1 Tax=Geobacter sp. OR-1 TaxID=1266765 RepID=UPI000542E914|nr:NAD(P)-dependent oxidoreductase [Geobacter sp. OR-1]GAM10557.1 spore coat polysaccharide biosynthesis protein SpsK [Geobacter sp. OR-1]